eukprot:519920-Amphidinium_carterae.1
MSLAQSSRDQNIYDRHSNAYVAVTDTVVNVMSYVMQKKRCCSAWNEAQSTSTMQATSSLEHDTWHKPVHNLHHANYVT